MAEIGFYHLVATPLDRALPRLLERARGAGHRIVVRTGSEARARDGNPAAQPIWLTDRDENPNGASMLVLVDGVEAGDWQGFSRGADLFDGNDADAVAQARARWRRARAAGHALSYWRQGPAGWERKA